MSGVAAFSGLSARLRVIGAMNMRFGSSYFPIFTGFKSASFSIVIFDLLVKFHINDCRKKVVARHRAKKRVILAVLVVEFS
jgi:hypothetical protein